ncbi:MAG: DNA translocase FtsK [Mycoplasma sp.]|nr:DNA translocase FtsK [Mycoplasma sp.]MDY4618448.1 DNA translocase FtsK [Bacilli bacterium]
MAKRKKSKESKSSPTYSVELTGLILILIGIIGMGFGIIGNFIKQFMMFLAGEFWFVILFGVLILGISMLFKRKLPKFFSSRLIGVYILFAIILVLGHFELLKKTNGFSDLMDVTYNNYMTRIGTMEESSSILSSGSSSIVIGGGLIGSLLAGGLKAAFSLTGTKIVLVVLGIFSFILIFNITLSDILNKFVSLFKKDNDDDEKENVKNKKEYIIEGDELVGIKNVKDKDEPTEKEKIVITSIDDLKNINTPEKNIKESFDVNPIENDEGASNPSVYRLPKFDLLTPTPKNKKNSEEPFIKENQIKLEKVLNDFDIKGKVVEIHIGPAVTEYEIIVPSGTKVSRIVGINKEIALAMAAKEVRIQAPIPGKNTIGIEIPNREISSVGFREVLEATWQNNGANKILVALGKDIMGTSILADLSKMPHLLVAGSTGSGKSVCINTIICSILMRYKPDEVKLVLVDPKKVELTNYNGIPHLLCPVVSDPKKASVVLQKVVAEMEKRYDIFAEKEVKNIAGYNDLIEKERKKNPDINTTRMPYIVVIIDELADLMLVASKEVQDSIMRITQMARAAGIHLIVATQRPSTDIITGVIKNNIPSRIAFSVSSAIDSRTILDASGAESLLGKGDMLYLPMGESHTTRIQGCFISDNEISKLIEYCKAQAQVKYNEEFTNQESPHTSSSGSSNSDTDGGDDPMYNEVVEFAIETGKISASLIQRRFRFGYNRAARMVDLLESRGIVGPQNGSKPREVLVKLEKNDNE